MRQEDGEAEESVISSVFPTLLHNNTVNILIVVYSTHLGS